MTQINGIENMTVAQLREEIQRGGKFVVYLYCISLVVITFRRGSGIYFVRANESAFLKSLPFTLLSLLAGWWGIPFGPIFTIEALIRNLSGGKDVTQDVMNTINRLQGQRFA